MTPAPDAPPALLRDRLLSPSGGLVWHATAWRRRGAWAPFTAQVSEWLNAWFPQRRKLVIVGGSAGYTLPTAWLHRFDERVVLEPDPLARLLWRLRRPGARFERLDVLAPGGLARLRHAHPDAAVLFANVLGQVACPTPRGWSAALVEHLCGVPWASYHEAFSTVPPATERRPWALQAPADDPTLVARFWPGVTEIELFDHGTLGLGAEGPHAYVPWSLRPGQEHLIEWCCRP